MSPGVKMIRESRKKGSVPVAKLHCALRDIKTFAEIENIRNSFDKQFLIYEYEGGGLVIKEVIPQMKSQTYTKLYYDYGTSY